MKDHTFTIRKGQTFSGGKSHHPNLLRLNIPRKEAMRLALEILNNMRSQEETGFPQGENLQEIALFGTLEESPEE